MSTTNLKWLHFAWQNLGRNRRRTLATLALTAIGVLGMMSTSGFALYTYKSLEEFSMRDQGHVILSHPDYFEREEEYPLQLGLEDAERYLETLRDDPWVRRALASIQFNGLVTNGEKSTIYLGEGVEPEILQMRGMAVALNSGRQLSPTPDPMDEPEVLLGRRLAETLSAEIGTGLTLLGTTVDGVLNAVDVRVQGIIQTGVPEVDSRLIMSHLDTAQTLLMSDRVSQLGVWLRDSDQADSVYRELSAQWPELGTTPWHERATFYHSVRDLYNRIFGVMGVILLLMIAFAIFNTTSMSVLERTREIGTLGAMGTRRREIMTIFLNEAALIGVLGSAIGLALAGLLSGTLLVVPVEMPPPPGQTEGYPLQVYWSPLVALTSTAMVTLIAVLSCTVATLRTVRKPITEALNHA